MITHLQTFVINSYFCEKLNGKTNQINYFFDCPQSYLAEVTHISCTNLNIPNTFYQLDETDSLTLYEGLESYTVYFSNGNYKNKDDMMLDLQNKLHYASQQMGNNHTYKVENSTSLINKDNIIITCNDKNLKKQIHLTDIHLQIMYGLKEVNIFVGDNDFLESEIINLKPINELYVHCSGVTSFNTAGLFSSDILAAQNINSSHNKFSIKSNMKNYNNQKNIIFSITDFDNELIDLNGNNWEITICLFKYEETFIDKLKMVIDYQVMKDQINEKEYGIVQNY
jgi:hypothetical protein